MAARQGPKRPTISQIAELTGVTAGAVSYALNGRPGVSDETRARIIEVAREIGWRPSTAARALRGGGTATLGLVITREPAILGIEPFFMAFIGGIEQVISEEGYALLLSVTPDQSQEVQTYRDWWFARRVDGLFMTDLMVDDPRLEILKDVGAPSIIVGDPAWAHGAPAVGSDDAGAACAAVERFAQLGHRRIGRIAGPERFVHTRVRGEALDAAAAECGVEIVAQTFTDYSLGEGSRAFESMLSSDAPPTAIICENDLTALGAVRRAMSMGLDVPGDVSVLAWDDSPLCQLTEPPLSALSRDVSAYGAAAARALLALIKGEDLPGGDWASVATLLDRGSLGPAKG